MSPCAQNVLRLCVHIGRAHIVKVDMRYHVVSQSVSLKLFIHEFFLRYFYMGARWPHTTEYCYHVAA